MRSLLGKKAEIVIGDFRRDFVGRKIITRFKPLQAAHRFSKLFG